MSVKGHKKVIFIRDIYTTNIKTQKKSLIKMCLQISKYVSMLKKSFFVKSLVNELFKC